MTRNTSAKLEDTEYVLEYSSRIFDRFDMCPSCLEGNAYLQQHCID